ncbi:MAG: LysM peptidoglycan-binding domain-containing protein [Acidobacteriia bacterium]|nr:LysM peptidoglycan-binding domain-containing protein [Terriglobia bacterium]
MIRLRSTLPGKPCFTLLPAVLALALAGCATLNQRSVDTPPNETPAPVANAPAVAVPAGNAVEEVILGARAHQAAAERAQGEGDAATARQEFDSAIRILQEGGTDPRLGEISAEISDEIKALDGAAQAGPDQVDVETEEVEPSPLDELATPPPELTPGEMEQERSLIDYSGLKFDIPFVVNDKVIAWVDFFTNRDRDKFLPGLIRSGRFLPMIRRIFAEEGLPQDLAYMAHVESAYKVNAFSRAKAKGIFQFIVGTGRRYGLRTDAWVDERSDPEKATRAAAAYLKDLYAMFGDWYLALAAYNAGEGKIQRVIDRTGERDFWYLAATRVLRNETANYVPAILAATLISKDPKRFGFEFEPDAPMDYENIRVEGSVHLKVLARCAGTDVDTMQKLNPALRRRQTPPGSTEVRVPAGTGTTTLAALAEVPAAERSAVARHFVAKGETLAGIARRYGVRTSEIRKANRMGKRTAVHPGESLIVPAGAADVADSTEPRPAARSAGATLYRVRRGDTLSSIARRYGTQPAAIASASGISQNRTLKVGDRLTVPGAAEAKADALPAKAARHSQDAARVVHTVRRGETLRRIADRYQVTVDRICALNDLSPDATIYPGLRLTIE